jgi:hypothetical protein
MTAPCGGDPWHFKASSLPRYGFGCGFRYEFQKPIYCSSFAAYRGTGTP